MSFVAFPHQINDLIKLRKSLQIISHLLSSGKNIDDDTLGDALFLAEIITTRDRQGTINDKLTRLKQKPRMSQSQLTTARDIRRLFKLFGMIDESNGDFTLTDRGKGVAKQNDATISTEEKKLWYEGLVNLTLHQDSTNTDFRPIRVMLGMLKDGPLQVKLLVFAFTAKDDTTPELGRIMDIINRVNQEQKSFEQELSSEGISDSNASNSVKILPAIAEEVGLISRNVGTVEITPFGRTVSEMSAAKAGELVSPPRHWRRPFFHILGDHDDLSFGWNVPDIEDVQYDVKRETRRKELLRARTDLHQETVDKFRHLFNSSWTVGVGNFDLLAVKNSTILLIEVKSLIQNDISDERQRIMEGIGELLFYETFDVPIIIPKCNLIIQKIMVFSTRPSETAYIDFLVSHDIWALWFDNSQHVDGEHKSFEAFQQRLLET